MNIIVPTGWKEVSEEDFNWLLAKVPYRQTVLADGEHYDVSKCGGGACGRRRVACRSGEKFYIDPTFFKSTPSCAPAR